VALVKVANDALKIGRGRRHLAAAEQEGTHENVVRLELASPP
jgi:hypothetical protein